jgi:two-component system cell cycle sensor histidine kinase/response regulator CckA
MDAPVTLEKSFSPSSSELAEDDRIFRALVENTPDLVARFDRQLRRSYVNPAIERLTGVRSSALHGKTMAELNFDPRFSANIEQALREVFETGAERTMEVLLPSANGERTFHCRVVAERGLGDTIDHVLVISRDITDIRRDQDRLVQLQTELERAHRMIGLGSMANALSHEFNNLLMGIQPFAEILLRLSSEEPRAIHAANRIIESIQRGRSITDDLRAFTSPASPVRSPIDVESWLTASADEVRRTLPPGVTLEVTIADTPMSVDGDRPQVAKVLAHLIANAAEAFDDAGGTVRLTAQPAAELPDAIRGCDTHTPFVELSVADDGRGIDAANLPHIFDPFYTTRKGGKGLGLALCHQIVTLHGGHLYINSEPHVGTTVRLFLPESR